MFRLSLLAAALALTTSAFAEPSYYVVVPMPGKVASAPAAPQVPITVTLNAYTLPAGMVTQAYDFNLNTVLQVTGDSAFNPAQVGWSIESGALPQGIALEADGRLAGVPQVVTSEAGASFEVKASYKGADGQQVYTIVVNGVALYVTQIAAGRFHTCAVTNEGGVYCWGDNSSRQLGDGTTTQRIVPTPVQGLSSGVRQISAGSTHTCALLTDKTARCWGTNGYGELGNNTTTSSATPVEVLWLPGIDHISAGDGMTCAVTDAGAAYCWGRNHAGQLGDGTLNQRLWRGNAITLPALAVQISAGDQHVCATLANGAVACWGNNGQGRLGDGTIATRARPTQVSGLTSGVAEVRAAANHTCARLVAGGVRCWGDSSVGQLGIGAFITMSTTPVTVSALSEVTSIAVGAAGAHTCALRSGGALWCWGYNNTGQLGDGTTTNRAVPVQVSGLGGGVRFVSVGAAHTCALRVGASDVCWGENSEGRLGDHTLVNKSTPTPVNYGW